MMKRFIFILWFIIYTLTSFSQNDTIHQKLGAYRNAVDYKNNKLLIEGKFIMTKLKYPKSFEFYDIKNIKPTDSTQPVTYFNMKYGIWAIIDSSNIYFNSYRFGIGKGFAKAIEKGRYCYIKGKPITNENQDESVTQAGLLGGLVGEGIAAGTIYLKLKDKIHYVIDVQNGNIHNLDKNYLCYILQPHADLYDQYLNEPNNETIEVLIKYVKLINDRLDSN
jgi:hypothetical protein